MTKIQQTYTIVLVLQDLEFGGTQRYAVNLLKHLDRKRFSPELWVLRGGLDMLPLVEETGVKVVWFSQAGWVTPLSLWRFFRHLARNRPVCLYPLTVVPNIWTRIFGRFLRIPIIISSYRSLHAKQWERLLWPLSTHIICNSRAIKRRMNRRHGVKMNRISVVKNGVDTNFFTPCPEKKSMNPTLCFVGRLVNEKDPVTSLMAFRMIREKVTDANLVMIGNGRLDKRVKWFVNQHDLKEHVTLLPGDIDVRSSLQKSWVFLMSSLSEGSPNIVVEAMSCGLPVVATNVGGIPEIIEDGKNGYLAPPGDYKKLAECCICLLSDEKLRLEVGTNSREIAVSDYDLLNSVSLTEKIFLDQIDPIMNENR